MTEKKLEFGSLARVLAIKNGSHVVVLNVGEKDGVTIGDKFLVYGIGEDILDIDTSENLGKIEIVRGKGVVTHVQEKICTLESIEKQTETIASKKIIKRPNSFFALSHINNGAEVIEEIEPSTTRVRPFYWPERGDWAKKI